MCFLRLQCLVLLITPPLVAADRAPLPDQLKPEEVQSLQKQFAKQGFDPAGKRFVRFQMPQRDVYGTAEMVQVWGWLIPHGPGEIASSVLLDGEEIPLTGDFAPADFIADSAELIRRTATTQPSTEPAPYPVLFKPPDMQSPSTLRAIWLHRLGRDDLAAAMLALVRRGTAPDLNPTLVPRPMGAWHDFGFAVHAFMVGADSEALCYAQRLNHEYLAKLPVTQPPNETDEQSEARQYVQGRDLLADLLRRKKDGSFNTAPTTQPALYSDLPVAQRVPRLIRDFQQIPVRQWSQPGSADLSQDNRVQALIVIGEPAVPALIDAIDNDPRLTRSVQFWRDFARSRTVLSVREAALMTLEIILQTQFRPPENVGDFTQLGEPAAKETAAKIRAYWKKYGGLRFDQRLMAILQDPKTTFDALREAADNLASFGGEPGQRRDARLPNPAVPRFANPTCAEAILAAMDRDLHQFDAAPHAEDYVEQRGKIETLYLEAVRTLGDARSAGLLHHRFDIESSNRMRRLYAAACAKLGDVVPLAEFADQVRLGTISLPPTGNRATQYVETPDDQELREIGRLFASNLTPATNAALYAMTSPVHPLYAELLFNVRRAGVAGMNMDDGTWAAHPYVLRILRQDLDREQSNGCEYGIREDDWYFKHLSNGANGWDESGGATIPPLLMDRRRVNEKVNGRICDAAGIIASKLIIGAPGFHPLLKDADSRLRALRQFLDAHAGHLRAATASEAAVMDQSMEYHPVWILDVHPTGHAATAADVAAGRAVFTLDGGGEPVAEEFPLTAIRKADAPVPRRDPTDIDVEQGRARANYVTDARTNIASISSRQWDAPKMLIVQAERDRTGKLWYGAFTADGAAKIAADELTDVRPLSKMPPRP
jgi:hypothetical protein